MRAGRRRHLVGEHRRLGTDPAPQDVGDPGEDRHADQCREQPSLEEAEPRQREDVERGVALEQRLDRPERHARRVLPEQEVAPLARHAERHEEGEHGRADRERPPHERIGDVTDPLEDLLVRREDPRRRPDPPRDDQVHVQDHEEQQPEHHGEHGLGPKDGPEHAALVDLPVPEQIDHEARERREQDDRHHDGPDDHEGPPA